jgi:uncharacterized membrane protein
MADLSMVLSSLMEIKEDIGKLKQAHEVSEQDRAETRTSIREINASVRELRAAQDQTRNRAIGLLAGAGLAAGGTAGGIVAAVRDWITGS